MFVFRWIWRMWSVTSVPYKPAHTIAMNTGLLWNLYWKRWWWKQRTFDDVWFEGSQMACDWQAIWGLLLAGLILLLVFSMGNNITQVLVIQISSNIQGKVCEHLVHLKEAKCDESQNSDWWKKELKQRDNHMLDACMFEMWIINLQIQNIYWNIQAVNFD